jgi:maltose O-acetyltransferase
MTRIIYTALYYSFAQHLPDSYTPGIGRVCNAIRVFICRRIFKKCGTKAVIINRKAYFGTGRELEIGNYSSIGAYTELPNDLIIGEYVMMAPHVIILSNNHSHEHTDIPMCQQGYTQSQRTIIEDDCWIGIRSLIMPGKLIKRGTIIAGGAVVTKNFPEYSIVGGNPAKLIKTRITP